MEKTIKNQQQSHVIWDCGSSLYDSFELKTFEKQLDSAIASRTLSMPHLSDRRLPPPPSKKPASRISRSLQRLVRSIFRPKTNNGSGGGYDDHHFLYEDARGGGFGGGVYGRSSGVLCTIPEGPEIDGVSPEIRSLVRRTASERFTAVASIGVY